MVKNYFSFESNLVLCSHFLRKGGNFVLKWPPFQVCDDVIGGSDDVSLNFLLGLCFKTLIKITVSMLDVG